jgi:hypothetical protein
MLRVLQMRSGIGLWLPLSLLPVSLASVVTEYNLNCSSTAIDLNDLTSPLSATTIGSQPWCEQRAGACCGPLFVEPRCRYEAYQFNSYNGNFYGNNRCQENQQYITGSASVQLTVFFLDVLPWHEVRFFLTNSSFVSSDARRRASVSVRELRRGPFCPGESVLYCEYQCSFSIPVVFLGCS